MLPVELCSHEPCSERHELMMSFSCKRLTSPLPHVLSAIESGPRYGLIFATRSPGRKPSRSPASPRPHQDDALNGASADFGDAMAERQDSFCRLPAGPMQKTTSLFCEAARDLARLPVLRGPHRRLAPGMTARLVGADSRSSFCCHHGARIAYLFRLGIPCWLHDLPMLRNTTPPLASPLDLVPPDMDGNPTGRHL